MNCCMILAGIIALFASFLNVVVLISSAVEETKTLNWAEGVQNAPCPNNECFHVYVGVFNVLTKVNSFESTMDWSSNKCAAPYCQWCETSMIVVLAFTTLSCVFSLPSIAINFQRSAEGGNTGCGKYSCLVFSFLTILCAIVVLVVFDQACLNKVEDSSQSAVDWYYGTAWFLMVVVAGLKLLDFLINMCVPYTHIRTP